MKRTRKSRVVGMLGVGFDHQDGHIRITQSEHYQVMMGSKESHCELQKICSGIEKAVQSSGRDLISYTPEELMELIQTIY
jgi:hypothetical protein